MPKVEQSLTLVENNWEKIDDELDLEKIGRKDTPFNAVVKARMMSAYGLLDDLLGKGVEPFQLKASKIYVN